MCVYCTGWGRSLAFPCFLGISQWWSWDLPGPPARSVPAVGYPTPDPRSWGCLQALGWDLLQQIHWAIPAGGGCGGMWSARQGPAPVSRRLHGCPRLLRAPAAWLDTRPGRCHTGLWPLAPWGPALGGLGEVGGTASVQSRAGGRPLSGSVCTARPQLAQYVGPVTRADCHGPRSSPRVLWVPRPRDISGGQRVLSTPPATIPPTLDLVPTLGTGQGGRRGREVAWQSHGDLGQ